VESHSPFLPNHQMVNTRNNQCNGQPSNNNNAHLEQLLTTQTQLMQAMLQTVNNMQPNQQHVPPPPPPHQFRLAEFLRTRPTTFSQAKDPMDAEEWLKGVEKKLMIAQCTDREKVLFATHQLYGTAANWWETYCNTHVNVDTITWNEFMARFRTHYVLRGTMKLKRKEFADLKQSGVIVNEYLNSFIQSSRYAPDDISTYKKKQDMFLNGLNDDIQFQLLNTDYADFQHMVDKAIVIENKIREMENDGKRKVPFSGQSSGSNVRPRFRQPNQFFKPLQMNRPPMPVQVPRSQFPTQRPNFHVQRPSFQTQRPQQQLSRPNGQQPPCQSMQQGPRPSTPTTHSAPPQGNRTGGACFKCGLTGHFAWQCPTRRTTPGAGNQVKPQGQQNFMRGRFSHMTSEEAQQASDVVLGMFLASSHPATILFDSGASHSFISSSFVAKHSLPIATMKHTMLVSSPGGEMRTKHICLTVSISIRGVDFSSNLILLDSKGIDIILGMDWLSKYDGVI
jgi:hypothetical protein